jgi:hypothetical protein
LLRCKSFLPLKVELYGVYRSHVSGGAVLVSKPQREAKALDPETSIKSHAERSSAQ